VRSTQNTGLVIGVDTHRDTHTAAICDRAGQALAVRQFTADPEGYAAVLAWARQETGTTERQWAIEGTRHYGLGLARYLTAAREHVEEIDSGKHAGTRRNGKSDAIDAVRAARELLARPAPKLMRADGDREALRLLMCDRDNAVASAKTARTLLASVIVTAPASIREQLRHIPRDRRATVCAALTSPPGADRQTSVLCQTLARLGQRITGLSRTASDLEKQISALVEELIPGLVAAEAGLGALTAAQLLLSYSHHGRIRTEAAFGMLSGTAPVPVSSGRTDRHRLNRLGDRQLNRALQVIAVTRMRSDPRTQAYIERRLAEGKTLREARRCIKRYLARHLYRALRNQPGLAMEMT
jgi:transposase